MPLHSHSLLDAHSINNLIAGHFNEPDTYVTRRPSGMENWLITYTLDGCGYFLISGHEQICQAGDVTLLKPETPHQYGTKEGQMWHFVWAHFSPQFMNPSLLPHSELVIQPVENKSDQKRIYQAFQRILSDSRERTEYWHELCLNSLSEILMLLAHKKMNTLDSRIEETLHLLSLHMQGNIRIEDLAKSVGLSPSRLSHLFKSCTGQTIIETLNRMRIREAALLLEHTDQSASEVSWNVGFQNYNHFINQFRKIYGDNPSRFKKKKFTRPIIEEDHPT